MVKGDGPLEICTPSVGIDIGSICNDLTYPLFQSLINPKLMTNASTYVPNIVFLSYGPKKAIKNDWKNQLLHAVCKYVP